MLFPQGHCDAGKYMLSVIGPSNSGESYAMVSNVSLLLLRCCVLGKTTLVRKLMECFCDGSKVTDITAGTFETKFGLAPRLDMHMCFLPDVKSLASTDKLNEEMFHGLIEGTTSTAAAKNASPLNNTKALFSIASMSNLSLIPHSFSDDGSNSMINRIAQFPFSMPPTRSDKYIDRVIRNELPAVFLVILQDYISRLEAMGHGRDMVNCKIKYFADQHALMREANINARRRTTRSGSEDAQDRCEDFIERFMG